MEFPTLIAGIQIGRGDSFSRPFAVAQNVFENALIDHWQSTGTPLDRLTLVLDDYYPRGPWFSSSINVGRRTRSINLPIVRELLLAITSSYEVFRWGFLNRTGAVLCTFHYPVVSAPMIGISRVLGLPIIVILTDLPLFSYSESRVAGMSWWKRLIMVGYRPFAEWLIGQYDGYVLFSGHMSGIVNRRSNPEIVVEGIFNPSSLNLGGGEVRRGVIAHAGTLDREYGIETLVDAFTMVDDPEAELWLFGSGDMDAEIRNRSQDDSRIRHFGFLPRAEVFSKLSEAALLVITRDPSAPYTKYSFPSKIFEYLATGTPVASTELAGIPSEYFNHLIKLHYGSPASLSKQLEAALKMDVDELRARGERGRKFVLEEKAADVQGGRIRTFVAAVKSHAS